MGKIISTTSMTIDGVSDVDEWFIPDGPHMDAALDNFRACQVMLTGRTTFEGLAGFWQSAEGPWADAINPMPKYAISRTVSGPLEWNGTAIAGDAVETVAKLKAEVDGDIFLTGCGELAVTLLNAGLVDQVNLGIFPTVWGAGTRAYEGAKVPMRLLESKTFDTGVTFLRYAPTL